MNKVYVVIVNYKNFDDTIECLESLLKSSYQNFQVFLIDNSPDLESEDHFKSWTENNDYEIHTSYPEFVFPLEAKPVSAKFISEFDFKRTQNLSEKLIVIKAENRGFAAANNIALKYILRTDKEDKSLIWILNNDTVIPKTTLANLVAFYLSNKNQKYVIGSKLMYYHRPDTLQGVAGKYNTFLGKHIHIGEGEKDGGQFDNFVYGNKNYIIGASIFFPKNFLKLTGLMEESYFLYFEELDWFESGAKAGFPLAFAPKAVVFHKEGASIVDVNTKDTSVAEYYSIVNRVKFIKKWYPYNLPTVLPGVIWALVKRLLKGKFGLVKKTSMAIVKELYTKNA